MGDFRSRWEENEAGDARLKRRVLLVVGIIVALAAGYAAWLLFGVNWAGAAA